MVKVYEKREVKAREKEFVKMEISPEMLDAILNGQECIEELTERVGLMFMKTLMNDEINRLAGKKHARLENRQATRWNEQKGYVLLRGKKVNMTRKRLRSADSRQEIPLETYNKFQDESSADQSAYNKLIRKLSSRDYEGATESFCDGYGIKRTSVSKRFIRASSKKLSDLLERDLSQDNYVVIGIDGLHIEEFCLIVAVGITDKGTKRVLGLWLGGTENSGTCKTLLADILRRNLNKEKNYIFVIDGSKALKKAIADVFGEKSPIQRCQFHKRENVKSHLPEKYQTATDMRLKAAYNMSNYEEARKSLLDIIADLKAINPSAASSLEEGFEETLTAHKLEITGALKKTISYTNFVESTFSMARSSMMNVKRWMNGNHIMRWSASALLEAEHRFRRVKGWRELQKLDAKLNPKLNDKNVDILEEVA